MTDSSSAPRGGSKRFSGPKPAFRDSSYSSGAASSAPRSFAPRSAAPRPAFGGGSGYSAPRPAGGGYSAYAGNAPRPAYGDRPSYGSGAPRPSFGGSRGGYSDRPAFGGSRGGFGGAPRNAGGYGARPSYGARSGFGGGKKRGARGEFIDPARFIKKASANPKQGLSVATIEHDFKDFPFVPTIHQNLIAKGYVTPTPIQDRSILPILEGKDVIGLANTGTGKTAAFLLPLLHKVAQDRKQNVLILAPTRELAQQINNEFRVFSAGLKIFSAICVGGTPIMRQIQDLRRGASFVIGTPGRVKDLIDRKVLRPETFNNVVLDEVDHMLDLGFIDAIRTILTNVPKERQSMFFSATMPSRIRDLVHTFMNNPVTIEVASNNTTDSVEQDVIRVKDRASKFTQLVDLIRAENMVRTIIFSETKRDVERLTEDLIKAGFRADSIHGDKRQSQRQRALSGFREGRVTILVATDVAARGLDVKDISHVINYTVPQTHDDYIHRIGRTGRGNSLGKAFTFVG